MMILGVDPGLANTGWGVVDFVGQKFRPVCFGVINTEPKSNLEDRIASIADSLGDVVDKYHPQHVSIEDIFFAKNEVSAIGVAKVIGAVSYRMHQLGVPVSMFTPLQIKIAITGYGRAEKKQVQEMCRILLGLDKIPRPDHAADALAAAVCWGNTSSTQGRLGILR